jgi:ankyrin repeat protein
LIEHGADVNAPTADGASPLHFAASYAQENVVRRLIQAGADIGLKHDDGKPACYLALMEHFRGGTQAAFDCVRYLVEAGSIGTGVGKSPTFPFSMFLRIGVMSKSWSFS